ARSKRGVERKFAQRHPLNTSGNRNKRTHQWHATPQENRRYTPPGKEFFRPVKVLKFHERNFAHQLAGPLPAKCRSNCVPSPSTDERTQRRCRPCQPGAHASFIG